MPNNLSQIEKLVLKGYFKRSKKAKQETTKDLDLSKLSTEQQKILDFMNKKFDFELNMLYFNSNSATFIAKGDDVFGESVIHGTIKHDKKMEFKKIYIGNPRHGLNVQRADSVDYIGLMKVFKEGIYCSGTYETHRDSPENGEWELSSFNKPRVWTL